MHLNQFYHVECEIPGSFDAGINIAERYIMTAASVLLERHEDLIRAAAGGISHITTLISHNKSNGERFARVTLADALALPEIAQTTETWKYVVDDDHSKGRVLTRLGERILLDELQGPVSLTEMDHLSVPFYQSFVPGSRQSRALCADLLLGPGEVLGLGERHTSSQQVKQALELHHLPIGNYEWYISMRDEGKGGKALRTTGWGMGVERFM